MTIGPLKKLRTLCSAWREIFRMPGAKRMLAHLVNPIDCTRYTEFAYLFSCFGGGLKDLYILDVSSPHTLAYMLSRENKVVKTNIDAGERKFIRESARLRFSAEDALALSFPDETFDLTYSVSVIEHIYLRYADAVGEMLRVTKKGGYLYLTFPVSAAQAEEWLPYPVYPAQKRTEKGFFFQYRFGEKEMNGLLASLADAEVVSSSVYWERAGGGYDAMVCALRKNTGWQCVNMLKNMLVHFYSGFFLLRSAPAGFECASSFGNASVILRKKGGQFSRKVSA